MSVPTSIPLKIRLNTMCINILIYNLMKTLCFFHIFFRAGKQPDWQQLSIVEEHQCQQEESECVRLWKLLVIKPHVLSLWRNVRRFLLFNNFSSVCLYFYNMYYLSSISSIGNIKDWSSFSTSILNKGSCYFWMF